jgi:putative ABC transport system permease protein
MSIVSLVKILKRPRPMVAIQLFLRSARIQRKRAILTTAAIAWSCLSLLLLLAFGEGLKRQVYRGTTGMGSNLAVIWAGETGRPWKGLAAGRPIRPRADDIEFLRERVPGAGAIVGEMRNSQVSMTCGDTTVTGRLVGTNAEYGEIRNHFPQPGGRFINHLDERSKRRVIFLGDELAADIFGEESTPVGKTLLVQSVPYTVVGVMKKRLQTSTYGGPDRSHAIIPITTFRAQFGWKTLSNIIVKPERPELMNEVLVGVTRALGARYGFDPEDGRALSVWNTLKTTALMLNILVGVQLFLGFIGCLTLVIGGVGVANIMYAVVKERTQEIGVKMALGARRGWITGPLVLEGVVYTLLGGLLGVLLAVGVISLVRLIPTEGNEALEFLGRPTLSPAIGIATAAILGLVGFLAGYFPARRAASIDPAQTLRYE